MSSRLFIQGLPPYVTDQRLRETFSDRGEVTDAKVVRTKDGHSRQFGFVGFSSVQQAEQAISYFNNTYIDTARIQVKFAEKAKSDCLARPWSKYSEGSTAFKKRHRPDAEDIDKALKVREQVKKKRAKYQEGDLLEDDPKLEEFLKVMQPRRAGTIWSNDDAVSAMAEASKSSKAQQAPAGLKPAQKTDDDEEELFQDLTDGQGRGSVQATKSSSDSEDIVEDSVKDTTVISEAVSDLEYLKSRMRAGAFGDEDSQDAASSESASEGDDEEEGVDPKGVVQPTTTRSANGSEGEGSETDVEEASREDSEAQLADRRSTHAHAGTQEGDGAASISETGRLFLRNLPYTATESDLNLLLSEYGELSEVHLVLDRTTRKSKGLALVQFMDVESAVAAYAALDGTIFQGRLLHILPARPAPAPSAVDEGDREDGEQAKGPAGYRQQREAAQRASAGNRAAWNTLFMRPDTVAEAIAAHYGVSKSQLLDRDAADLPVRMALGEAHVISLTKSALGEAGVNTAALEAAATASGSAAAKSASVERSNNVLLVKNLPYTTTEADLMEVFGKRGVVARLVLPPTRTLALVEYQDAGAARHAFKTLAYKRFQSVPLYLEWAPRDTFTSAAPPPRLAFQAPDADAARPSVADVDLVSLRESNDEDVESNTIFVKNLAWATGDKQLTKHFDSTVSAAGGTVRAVKVAKRKGPDGKPLSAGYGFVECSSEAVAKVVLRKLQGSTLDGHKLVLQLSMRKTAASADAAKANKGRKEANAKKGTKLVVRNVAFEATSKEIRALFQPFGQIKSCRLPRKFDNSHRGFAFVDLLSHQEAVNAMEAVAGTHLYGRRLLVEWANEDEGLDELRARTAAKFSKHDH